MHVQHNQWTPSSSSSRLYVVCIMVVIVKRREYNNKISTSVLSFVLANHEFSEMLLRISTSVPYGIPARDG